MAKIVWDEENVATLLRAESDTELQVSFPGANLETLKRRQREFKNNHAFLRVQTDEIEEVEPGSISLTGDSGVIKTGTVAEPITDWTDTLKVWGLDPNIFEVIQPVTMKAWGKPGEFRYSYAARIQKKELVSAAVEETVDIVGWRETLRNYVVAPARTLNTSGNSYLILVADPQLGKPGTNEAVDNWTRGIEGHLERINRLVSAGYLINDIALAFMGDEHEGAVGNYASQPYEVELSYSDQVTLDFDMRVWSIRQLLHAGLPISIASVPSNHGEHTRFGSNKVMTSIYDNSSTMVAKLAKRVFDGTSAESLLTWNIAEDRQDVNLELSGVKANFTHGHIAKGSGSATGGNRSKSALEKQILGRVDDLYRTNLFFSAHYHHFNVIEDRGRSFFGCPALEAEKSSQWFYDSSGVWSKPGMLGMAVGQHIGAASSDNESRCWGELAVI